MHFRSRITVLADIKKRGSTETPDNICSFNNFVLDLLFSKTNEFIIKFFSRFQFVKALTIINSKNDFFLSNLT